MSVKNNPRGVVAAGHGATADAAIDILREGGNAFDAALAALFTCCVVEPVLASLGGGGFLLTLPANGRTLLYDFFPQTPSHRPPRSETDLFPILADFGTAQQEFHIGLGSIAVPGVIKGLFAIHRDLCRLPLKTIIAPALDAAKEGTQVNSFQHYISSIVTPIIKSSPAALNLHQSPGYPGRIAKQGELVRQPDMADAFDILAKEGEDLFYRGEMGQQLVRDCREGGGCLSMEDLEQYRVVQRNPLEFAYHDARILTNPAPSIGGTLIAFTLSLLQETRLGTLPFHGPRHLQWLADAMQITQQLRHEQNMDRNLDEATSQHLLSQPFLAAYRKILQNEYSFSRGTTQISIADAEGNIASMTLSNGEGSGYVLPGSGIMLNNMLGEQDLSPHGFHQWPENRRISSMMSPTLLFLSDGTIIATGSGGSNRIRSAILQVLINLVDFEMTLDQAVEQPRIHFESGILNLENGIPDKTVEVLMDAFLNHRLWPEKNLFFGGAHSVMQNHLGVLSGRGDSRRGGVYRYL